MVVESNGNADTPKLYSLDGEGCENQDQNGLGLAFQNGDGFLVDTRSSCQNGGADVTLLRDREARLLLDISAVVAGIREAPATTLHDHLVLLDVAIEHEIDLAADIAYYGARDFPMITRLLRALARTVPGFEFNSLRRALSSPGQFEQLMDDGIEAGGPVGSGRQ